MPHSHPDLGAEQGYIDRAYELVDEELARIRQEPAAEQTTDTFSARMLYRDEEAKRERLEAVGDGICFGRIDPDGEGPLYIGKQLVMDGAKHLVVSWQAQDKVRPFYEANVHDRMGIERRRRFLIRSRRLESIDEDVFIEGAPEPKVPSDSLLAELEMDRSPEMRDIVATIQADQYRLIANPLELTLVIQGGPGTGKTVVGLHRASFLLFNHKERLEREGVLVVGPNPAFMEYISRVLPSLGETSVDQVTVGRLASIRPKEVDPPAVARLKGDVRLAEILRRELDRRITPDVAFPLRWRTRDLLFPVDEIAAIVDRVRSERRPYMEGRAQFRERVADGIVARLQQEESLPFSEEQQVSLLGEIKASTQFHNACERVWPTMTGRQLVHELLTGPRRLAMSSDGTLNDDERALVRREQSNLEQARWTRSDVALVHEADCLVSGPRDRYGHVILDEAQDLTPMEVLMVGRHAAGGSITILGDLAQATGVWPWRAWEEMMDLLPVAPASNIEELVMGYRVPMEIMELGARLLTARRLGISIPESIRPTGEEPRVRKVGRDGLAEESLEVASRLLGKSGTVGIIAAGSHHAAIESLASAAGVDIFDVTLGGLGTSISILDPQEAKGLEFDHVVVVEPLEIYQVQDVGDALLYVALTRATRSLSIVHSAPLPEVLGIESEPHDREVPEVEVLDEVKTRVGSNGEKAVDLVEALILLRMRSRGERTMSSAVVGAGLAAAAESLERGGSDSEAASAMLSVLDEDEETSRRGEST